MKKQINKHLGIIPDGGRRWARKNNVPISEAYILGFSRLYELLTRVNNAGFNESSIYILSKDNLARLPEDLNSVYIALPSLHSALDRLCKNEMCESVQIIGDISLLPDEVQHLIETIALLKGKKFALRVNLLVAYNAWDELSSNIINNESKISLENLWVKTKVDAVIRTGGSALLSGFLPLQSQYAHLLTTEKMFDDLSDTDFDNLVKSAAEVTHLYGK